VEETMTTIGQLLAEKGQEVFTIAPEATVYDAIKAMSDRDIGALMVVDSGKPSGMVTERLYAREVVLKGRASHSTLVREVMEMDVAYARLDQTVEECMAVMTARRTRHLPVIADGRLAGMVSIGDLVKSIITHHEFTIEQLIHYIHL
jgi:CBS domain-containing protein